MEKSLNVLNTALRNNVSATVLFKGQLLLIVGSLMSPPQNGEPRCFATKRSARTLLCTHEGKCLIN